MDSGGPTIDLNLNLDLHRGGGSDSRWILTAVPDAVKCRGSVVEPTLRTCLRR
jgi:hypothetical protein